MTPEQTEHRGILGRIQRFLARNEMGLVVVTLIFLIVLAFFWGNIVISIRSGEVGVMWSRIFGTTTDRLYLEGTHLVVPWNVMTIYNVRYQHVDRSFLVLSRDGLEITVDVTIRFKPMDKQVPKLHQQVGPTYVDTIVGPEVNTAVRTVIGRFRPDELYAASFDEIQADIVNLARREVRNRYVEVDDVLLRTIVLPPIVANAIQRKLEQEQLALEMQYRLSRERQEADRKRIESEGIRDYHRTVQTSLTAQLLQFKGIEATLDLARSNNAKVVVIGSGRDGLPLILNTDSVLSAARTESPAAPAAAASAATPASSGSAAHNTPAPAHGTATAAVTGVPPTPNADEPTARRSTDRFIEEFDTESQTARVPTQRNRSDDLTNTDAARYPSQPTSERLVGPRSPQAPKPKVVERTGPAKPVTQPARPPQ